MGIDKQKNFLIRFAFVAVILLLAFIALKFTLGVLLPFLAAFLIAALLDRPIRYLCRRFPLKRSLAAIPIIILFFGTAGLLFTVLGFRVLALITSFFAGLPHFYSATLEPAMLQLFQQLEGQIAALDPAAQAAVSEVGTSLLNAIGGLVSSLSMAVIGVGAGAAATVPGAFFGVLITIIVTFFITLDYPAITGFLARQLPEKARAMTEEIRGYVGGTLLKCILSYGLIMAVTFAELSLGLSLLGVPNAILIALAIAVFDILPVLGTGGIMIPWAILTAVLGDYGLALSVICSKQLLNHVFSHG